MTNSPDRPIRFGCIGCGGIGRVHVRNSQFVPGMAVTAFADIDRARAETFCDTFGGRYATTDAQEIFQDPDLDTVPIHPLHASQHA